ncbi:MAG: hypothetical protein MZV70_55745 [Desulfobacterales bacterium]|nr:hypothetical protein [Desulfobacterales bacterium]
MWRRLKGMGAVYLQNGVCLLPKIDDHARRLKMLQNDVTEMGGESVILETAALDRSQQEKVVARFMIGSRRGVPGVHLQVCRLRSRNCQRRQPLATSPTPKSKKTTWI